MLHKGLLLILVLALSFVPVFQVAHALTHVAHVDMSGDIQADGDQGEREADAGTDADADRICLDCLALTAFSVILPILAFLFFGQMRRLPLPHSKSRRVLLNFSSPYLTRAPPRA